MSCKVVKRDIGRIGEDLIVSKLSDVFNMRHFDDWYDDTGDAWIFGDQKAEIKTLRFNFKHDGVLIDTSQYRKIDDADHLFINLIPEKRGEPLICTYVVDKNCYYMIQLRNGTYKRLYRRKNLFSLLAIRGSPVKDIYDMSCSISKYRRFTNERITPSLERVRRTSRPQIERLPEREIPNSASRPLPARLRDNLRHGTSEDHEDVLANGSCGKRRRASV